ncbi:squalene/phytoene synthase family protein [Roseobacter weihaiensis]|uniref:squalene/phytoene synthase family protein n=1 Tax=Roseobacter weihaiensis TaxID=2763262 RepID=UPI001D09E612|nr:squalene/phytoene synthase family protein [Roseobacter sp. H9]
MSFDDNLTACAAIVEKGDPDRFAAAMASPLAARGVLFPLYAFNVEVARAPWVTQESMIAEMRLQWWRDALEEIASDARPRRHEVVTPLSEILDRQAASDLDKSVAVRRWDIYKDAFEDAAHFEDYLMQTAGTLMWVAARLLGAPAETEKPVRALGYAAGLARFFQAIPELEARGRVPLLDGRMEAISALAKETTTAAQAAAQIRRRLPKPARAALTEAFQAQALLAQAASQPTRVPDGMLALHPVRRSWLLWRWS